MIYAHFSFSSLSAAGGSSGWEMWNSVQRFLQLPASSGREHGQLSTGTGREGKPSDHLHVRETCIHTTDEIYVCESREGEKREEPDGRRGPLFNSTALWAEIEPCRQYALFTFHQLITIRWTISTRQGQRSTSIIGSDREVMHIVSDPPYKITGSFPAVTERIKTEQGLKLYFHFLHFFSILNLPVVFYSYTLEHSVVVVVCFTKIIKGDLH